MPGKGGGCDYAGCEAPRGSAGYDADCGDGGDVWGDGGAAQSDGAGGDGGLRAVVRGDEEFPDAGDAWGEVGWRGALVQPTERFVGGTIAVPSRPGFGITLNEELTRAKRML